MEGYETCGAYTSYSTKHERVADIIERCIQSQITADSYPTLPQLESTNRRLENRRNMAGRCLEKCVANAKNIGFWHERLAQRVEKIRAYHATRARSGGMRSVPRESKVCCSFAAWGDSSWSFHATLQVVEGRH